MRRQLRAGWLMVVAMVVALSLGTVQTAESAARPPAGPKVNVNLGPMIGGITASGAVVWARLSGAATARVAYRTVDAQTDTQSAPVTTSADTDYTLQVPLPDLQPDTAYRYQVIVTQANGNEIASGVFYFHSASPTPQSLSFSVLADFMIKDTASPALTMATSPRPDFIAVIGDLDHRGPAINPATKSYYPIENSSIVLANMRKMRRDMRSPTTPIGQDFVAGLMASPSSATPQIPLYYVWDDHDFCGNNSDASCPFAAQSLETYREYFVSAADNGTAGGSCGQAGVWQRIQAGGLATVFMLDSRMNRDEAGGTTMLGACQKAWLLDGLLNAATTWKIVLSPVTLNPGTKPTDGWGHFSSEHDEIVSFVRDNGILNVIFLSGDIHSGGAVDDGTHSGLPEVSVPHANMPADWVDTYCKVDRSNGHSVLTSEPGTWTIGGLTDPNIGGAPHQCLGKAYSDSVPVNTLPPAPYPLAGAGRPGFVSVQLTPTTASIRVLDPSGQQRTGFLADGTPADLALALQAQ